MADASDVPSPPSAFETGAAGAWYWNPHADVFRCNARALRLLGRCTVIATLEDFIQCVHVDDRASVQAMITSAVNDCGHHQVPFRLAGNEYWLTLDGNTITSEQGVQLLGTLRNLSAIEEREREQSQVLRQMTHDLANVFSMATSMVTLCRLSVTTAAELAESLQGRFRALAAAHEMLRTLGPNDRVLVDDIVRTQLTPFADLRQIHIAGPAIACGRRQAINMNLIVHELATNAAKHGALFAVGGELSVTWRVVSTARGDRLLLSWKETCAYQRPSARKGIGLRLLDSAAKQGLNGDIAFDFQDGGLLATLTVPVRSRHSSHGRARP